MSNYTFLHGASHPDELVERAHELGYRALAMTDECSLAGVVRAHLAARRCGLQLIIGSQFTLEDGLSFVLLATDRASYGRLSALITAARRRASKGEYQLGRAQLASHDLEGCLALWLPGPEPAEADGRWLSGLWPGRVWLAVALVLDGEDRLRLARLQSLGRRLHIPLCAAGDVRMHGRERQPLQDVLTAIRLNTPLSQLGRRLFANAERHLRPRARLAKIYPPDLLEQTLLIAARCRFSLDELRYEYPRELVPEGTTPAAWLRQLVVAGMARRWGDEVPAAVLQQVEHELALIAELRYEPYFLTVYDIVCFARSQQILCQGRGSAANSAVCYCLGITEVDPARMTLLFERFLSRERDEPPDIDVDFEHERREEVIQYIYKKYGRERAALAATVITYRPRSAIRDVGKALGLGLDQVERLAGSVKWWDGRQLQPQRLSDLGFDPQNPLLQRLAALVAEVVGFPRHLSQHVGGFVISQGALSQLVPVENAAMADRTVIQWEKDDLEALGLLKVDVLALGMLTAIRKALDYISQARGKAMTMADVPAEDPAVYAMMQRAETMGVFQIESRAQMSMLPRLKPNNYYDLVVQIAIVRPGPIQGDMVHPYLARRKGLEPVDYPSEAVKGVLERTLGVPIFQEQVMQLAIVAAGFTPGEADQLRRAMAAWKRKGGLEPFERKLFEGMRKHGYSPAFAERIFRQIKGFGDYGFPESHSASFALLAYVSSWLKHYHPAAFTCALLNSQPMGFYAPAQLVQEARRSGVAVWPVDVCASEVESSLVWEEGAAPALRLGLHMVAGLSQAGMAAVCRARSARPFVDVNDLACRARLARQDLESLAAADALTQLAGHRHRAYWQVSGVEPALPLFGRPRFTEADVLLRRPGEAESVVADYASTGLTLKQHPLALLRPELEAKRVRRASELQGLRSGSLVRVAGLVIGRQRPGSARGVIFVTLEDESGVANVIVWPSHAEVQRKALLGATLLMVTGTLQHEDGVLHVVAGRLSDLSEKMAPLSVASRDFH